MPAAAVIPAPEAYVNVAAVKTLVVGCAGRGVCCVGRKFDAAGPCHNSWAIC